MDISIEAVAKLSTIKLQRVLVELQESLWATVNGSLHPRA